MKKAITHAALARDDRGKRYSHQSRITKKALGKAKASLLTISSRIKRCRNFGGLFQLVSNSVGASPGLGELYIYDTALRLGAYLKLSPDEVYLHRGTRDGVRKLGYDWHKHALQLSELPTELHEMPPSQIEDILCIYAKHLSAIRSRTR